MMKRQLGLLWFALALLLPAITNAGTTTTNYDLYKPEEGDVGWADLINGNADTIDAEIKKAKTSVNTTELDSPDLTDSASLTWGVSGSEITGTVIEADTLDSVAERGATTDVASTFSTSISTPLVTNDSANLTLSTTTSGDIIANPFGAVIVGDTAITSDAKFGVDDLIVEGALDSEITDLGAGSGGISNANILDDDCSSLTGWSSFSFGTIGQNRQVTFDGKSTFNFSIAVGTSTIDTTNRYVTNTTGNRVTQTIGLYIDSSSQGTTANGNYSSGRLRFHKSTSEILNLNVCKDGLYYDTGSGSVTLAYAMTFNEDQWYIITLDLNKTTNNIDIYIDGSLVVDDGTAQYESGSVTADQLWVGVVAWGANTVDTYFDYVKEGDGLTAAGYVDQPNGLWSVQDDARSPIDASVTTVGRIGTDGDLWAGGESYLDGEVTVGRSVDADVTFNTDHFKIKGSSGNVGIGTANPTSTLDIVGDIGVADNGNACVITVDTDGTCDAGTAIVVDNSIAICAVCS